MKSFEIKMFGKTSEHKNILLCRNIFSILPELSVKLETFVRFMIMGVNSGAIFMDL